LAREAFWTLEWENVKIAPMADQKPTSSKTVKRKALSRAEAAYAVRGTDRDSGPSSEEASMEPSANRNQPEKRDDSGSEATASGPAPEAATPAPEAPAPAPSSAPATVQLLAPRLIPDDPPDTPAPPPGRAPRGDSRSFRRQGPDGEEFCLIYRYDTHLITRRGTVGVLGTYTVTQYPSHGGAAHAYAHACSDLQQEGFRDFRG